MQYPEIAALRARLAKDGFDVGAVTIAPVRWFGRGIALAGIFSGEKLVGVYGERRDRKVMKAWQYDVDLTAWRRTLDVNPSISVAEVKRRLSKSAGPALLKSLHRQQQRNIDRVIAAYKLLPHEQKRAVEEAEERWFEYLDSAGASGSREPYESLVNTLVPGTFTAPGAVVVRSPKVQRVAPVEDLQSLPEILYHGSREPLTLLTEGISVASASELHTDTHAWQPARVDRDGWPIAWGPIVWNSWWLRLSKDAKRSVQQQSGVTVRSIRDLGKAVSLFWTFDERPASAAAYASDGVVLEIDPRRLSLYGWFEANYAGNRETVLVLSPHAPQGGPDAVVGGWVRE